MAKAAKLELCPMCGSTPYVWSVEHVRGQGLAPWYDYWCRCMTCHSKICSVEKLRKMNATEEKDVLRFGYGTVSQTSESAAMRQWNQMVFRRSARILKAAVSPPKIVNLCSCLSRGNASKDMIGEIKRVIAFYKTFFPFVSSEAEHDKDVKKLLDDLNTNFPKASNYEITYG